MNRTGVRYITEDLLKISAHEDRLERIKILNVDCGKEDKKIRYIEHLDNLINLNILSLKFHAIEKIEKLDKLANLRELYLGDNKITKLDGLENLLRLKILDVRGNQICSIPHWFTRRCKYLTKINLSRNMFDSIEEISKLWTLKDLVDLDVSENPVASVAHYRSFIVMRLKYLQIFDNKEVLTDERKIAIEQFEENELDRITNRLAETEKQLDHMKENQIQLQNERAKQEQFQKDLHKKQKSNIEQIKQLEESLKSKDLLLKKKSEDLFRACQKYYELEQDIAFIKIDAKFDLLSNNIGPLEEPDNLSEHSQISSTGDQAYMGKGQFITKKEADMLLERKRTKHGFLKNGKDENDGRNSTQRLKEDFVDSLNERVKEKLFELDQINKELTEKNKIIAKLNSDIDNKELFNESSTPTKLMKPGLYRSDRPRSALASINRLSPLKTLLSRPRRLSDAESTTKPNDHSSITDLFLEKVENLTEMQKEAEELRRQMESTEKESNRQQKDIAYLRTQLEKFKVADPNLANHIENEMKEKEHHADESLKLYDNLSNRLDQLSLAIEKCMNDIEEIEVKLLEDNQYFTNEMREKINNALSHLTQSLPNRIPLDYKKVLDNYKEADLKNQHLHNKLLEQNKEIESLKSQIENDGMFSFRKSARSIDDEVEILRQELNQLRQDALAAKDDLESEIEMEKVLNDELQKQIEDLKANEKHMIDEFEALQDKHRKLIDKNKTDQHLMKNNIEQELLNFQDDMLHRVKMASSENKIENLEKSKNLIDKALLDLIKSITNKPKPEESSIDPEISQITEDLSHIKNQLFEMNKKISPDLPSRQVEDPLERESSSISKRKYSKTLPIKKMLSNSRHIYKNEMSGIKSRIKDLQDSLNGHLKMTDTKNSSKLPKPQLFNKMSKETSIYFSSSEDIQSTPKPRAQSQDRITRKSKPVTSTPKKWSSVQQNISSDEQAIFDDIQNELSDLIKHINSAEYKNNQRIDEAMNRLSDYEREIQNSNEDGFSSSKTEHLDQEKENLAEFLKETMSQIERCQEDIRILNERFGNNIRISRLETGNNIYGIEMEKMSGILQNQKAEIERLNNILEKLTKSAPSNFPHFIQTSPGNNTPMPSATVISNGFLPYYQNSHSTPMLNNNSFSSVVPSQMKNAGSLFCNVPEHHFLEDQFQINGNQKSSLKMKRKFKSESEKYIQTLDLLKDDINKKNEELDNVEIQISKQTNEIGRLNYQIDQLNFTKQDLLNNLSSLRQETEHVTRETIASTSETLGQMKAKKSQLSEELSRIDLEFRNRKDEFFRAETELKNCRLYLMQVQEQTSETIRKHDEARMHHRKLILECEDLEKRSKDASLELARAMNDLNAVQNEISNLSTNKVNLEEVLIKIQSVINQKDQDFSKLNEEINKATQQLSSLKSDLNMTAEQNREKMHMLSEGDQLLSDTRLELNRLKNEIVLNQEQLQKMESEIGERNAAIDVANSELERSRQIHHRLIQDYQSEQTRIKRELSDHKFDLENIKDEKNDLLCTIENLKMKSIQMKENIDKQEQTQMIQQSDLDKLNWQTQHIDNMLKIKQGQLDKVLSEYQSRLLDLEKVEEQIHQGQIESKRFDSDIKRKAIEVDKIRQTIATDTEFFQRLQFDKDNLETGITTISKEKNLLQNEKKELEANIKILRKQESQSHDILNSLESKVSEARTELEKIHSEKCSETIKRDELKIQCNNISKQLHESKCELQSLKERLIMIEAQCDERTGEIRKKMQLQSSLNIEIRKLQDQIRLGNMSFDEVNNEEQQKRDKLSGLDNDIARKSDEIKNLEKKIYDLENSVLKEDNKLEKILKTSSHELAQLKSEITEKLRNLEATGNKLHQIKKDVAIKEFTEQKIYELEEIIKQQENNIDHYVQENRKLSNHLSVLNRDLTVLREHHQFEIENKDKEITRLRKRVAKEIFQLEKLAEDQCSRANSLADDLNQARRDYMLLRNRIVIFGRFLDKESTCLSQEHFIEQQNLFKEYMQPSNAKFPFSWEANTKNGTIDLPIGVETAMLAEHQRHLQNQLNLLKDNIHSATQDSQNGIAQHTFDNNPKWNTGSSGLGSTFDHTGNSSDTFENDKLKKALHTQFNADIELMNNENNKSELLCHQLRNEVDNLKSNFLSEKSPLSLSE